MLIAHIADLHLNSDIRESNYEVLDRILQYLKIKDVDHIVITGDISEHSNVNDYRILNQLFDSYGLTSSDKLTIILGNHDIFGGLKKVEDVFTFPEHCKNVDYLSKVKTFFDEFFYSYEGVFRINKNDYFPFAKKLGNILLIGINSIIPYSLTRNPLASNGEVDMEQRRKVEELIKKYGEECKFKVVLIHHHFNKILLNSNHIVKSIWNKLEKQTLKLWNKKDLLKFFEKSGIDLVLHGHYHLNEEYKKSNITFLNAGGCIKNEDGRCLLNLIKFNKESFKSKIIDLSTKTFYYRKRKISSPLTKYLTSNVIFTNPLFFLKEKQFEF